MTKILKGKLKYISEEMAITIVSLLAAKFAYYKSLVCHLFFTIISMKTVLVGSDKCTNNSLLLSILNLIHMIGTILPYWRPETGSHPENWCPCFSETHWQKHQCWHLWVLPVLWLIPSNPPVTQRQRKCGAYSFTESMETFQQTKSCFGISYWMLQPKDLSPLELCCFRICWPETQVTSMHL